jgi:hypothetical protein
VPPALASRSVEVGGRTLLSFEEPLGAAAQGMVRTCFGRPARDRCLTFRGRLSFIAARHAPALVDWLIRLRMGHLVCAGMQISLEQQA